MPNTYQRNENVEHARTRSHATINGQHIVPPNVQSMDHRTTNSTPHAFTSEAAWTGHGQYDGQKDLEKSGQNQAELDEKSVFGLFLANHSASEAENIRIG